MCAVMERRTKDLDFKLNSRIPSDIFEVLILFSSS